MTTGVLPLDQLKFQINLNTGFFECSAYTEDDQMKVCSGNHDGAGMSAGNLQYNFGAANRLTELWQYMINNYESICINAFGSYTTQYNTWKTALMSSVQQDRINFGANITDPNNDHAIIDPYKTCLGNLLLTSECKAKYYSMRDTYYFPLPYDLFKQLSCFSRAALASLFDIYINRGRFYPINLIAHDFEIIDADTTLTADQKEAAKIQKINTRANEEENAMSDSSTEVFRPRRDGMGNQGGTYYGLTYDPETQFDINQEPAIIEKTAAMNINFGANKISNINFGLTSIKNLYLGANNIARSEITPYTTTKVPQTQFRTNPASYAGIGSVTGITLEVDQPLWVDVQNFVAAKTYFTTDGSTPTTGSTVYTGALQFKASCTLKALTVSLSGIAEAVKTLAITIPVANANTYRYLKIDGYGENGNDTTRIVEVEAYAGTVNVLANKIPISYDTTMDAGLKDVAACTNGNKTGATNTYPIWWSVTPNANLIYDLITPQALTKLNYYAYSTSTDQRANQFIIYGSNTNNGTDWVELWNMSTNTVVQPILPNGYEKVL